MRVGTTGRLLALGAAAAIAAAPATASAQQPDETPAAQPEQAQQPPTVLPGEADGIAVEESHPERELLWIPRVLLAPLRFAFLVGTEPVYQLAELEHEYGVRRRAIEFFFNDEETFGWYPTAFIETGLGFNVGARVVHRDLFGENETLTIRGGYGRRWRQEYGYSLGSGDRFGDFNLGLGVQYRRMPHRRFFGFGPEDERDPDQVDLPLDARTADVAVRSFYRLEEARGTLTAKGPVGDTDRWTLRVRHEWQWRRFRTGRPQLAEDPNDAWIDEIYIPESVVGFLGDSWFNYNELRLTFDNSEPMNEHVPLAVPSRGWKVAAWGGWHVAPGQGRNYGRLGLDVQPFADLYHGDRVLRFRFRVTSLVGDISNVVFIDQPKLGGSMLLRGYPRDRFRGRATALSQIEYRYPIQPNFAGFVFGDAGRVWEDGEGLHLDDIKAVRVGFGIGLMMYTEKAFLVGAQLSTSIDGGFFVRMNLNTTHGLVETR